MSDANTVLDAAPGDAAAPPRSNGELVFDQPWQSRAFGMAVGLSQAGSLDWDEFRARLVARITARGAHGRVGAPSDYWEHWLGALEDVLAARALLDPAAIDGHAVAVAHARAHDHDHRH